MLIHYLIRAFMFIVFAFAMADVWATNRALSVGAKEANPIYKVVMNLIHDKWVIVRLLFAQLNIWLVMHSAVAHDSWIGLTSFLMNCALMTWVIWNNVKVYNNQKKFLQADL